VAADKSRVVPEAKVIVLPDVPNVKLVLSTCVPASVLLSLPLCNVDISESFDDILLVFVLISPCSSLTAATRFDAVVANEPIVP